MSALQAVIRAAMKAAEKSALKSVSEKQQQHTTTKSAPASTSASTSGIFMYQDKPYIKVIPAKRLFNSTMVHEVVTRGDFFAVCMTDYSLTILPGGALK